MLDMTGLINTVITMTLLIGIGFFSAKIGVITEAASKNYSSLIVTICQAFLMVTSLITSTAVGYTFDTLFQGLIIVAISAAIHAFCIIVSQIVTIGIKNVDEKQMTRYCMVFSNNAFTGFPILNAVFGAKGVFWATFYCVFFNILVWTWGIFVLSRANKSIKMCLKNTVFNIGTISVAIGLVLYIAYIVFPNFRLPESVTGAMTYMSGLCTPITMLICGASISRMKPKQLLLNPKIYFLCAVKLIAIPLCVGFVVKGILVLFNLTGDFANCMVLFSALMAGLPTAASSTAFAEKYDVAPSYTAACVGMTTIVSMATIPLTVLIFK